MIIMTKTFKNLIPNTIVVKKHKQKEQTSVKPNMHMGTELNGSNVLFTSPGIYRQNRCRLYIFTRLLR